MALTFDYEKELNTGTQPYISHEKTSVLFNYYINSELAFDKNASINNGDYSNIAFSGEERHLTTKAVTRIGIKNFPGVGGIGFYKDAYSDNCRIVAPIHPDSITYKSPTLTSIEIVNNKLHIVVTPPSDISYTCYRVVVKQGAFAFEYIIYRTTYGVDIPTVKGDYIAYCIGYDENNGTVSENSNELSLNVPTGTDDWSPYFAPIDVLNDRMDTVEAEVDDVATAIPEINLELADHEERIAALEGTSVDWSMPILSDNTATIEGITYTISADSSINTSMLPWRAFDGINADTLATQGNSWHSGRAYSYGTHWLMLQVSTAIQVETIIIHHRYTVQANENHNLNEFVLEGSNDNSTWTELIHNSCAGVPATSETFSVESPASYLYYRLREISTHSVYTNECYLVIGELNLSGVVASESLETRVAALESSVTNIEEQIGDIGSVLDAINGEVV